MLLKYFVLQSNWASKKQIKFCTLYKVKLLFKKNEMKNKVCTSELAVGSAFVAGS